MVEKQIFDVSMVANAISNATKKQTSKPAITKNIEVQIKLEADQYIFFSIVKVNLDFELLGTNPGNAASMDILLHRVFGGELCWEVSVWNRNKSWGHTSGNICAT